MPRRPDTPCAGCGTLLWSGTGSKSAGERRCRDCRKQPRDAECSWCEKPFKSERVGTSYWKRTCSDACRAEIARSVGRLAIGALKAPGPCDDCGTTTNRGATGYGRVCEVCAKARESARYINKNHRRRLQMRETDITPAFLAKLRTTTTECSLCSTELTDEFGFPNSKHLDHILPLVAGGTHTMANVRIICRTCNLTRPYDGSDLPEDELVAA